MSRTDALVVDDAGRCIYIGPELDGTMPRVVLEGLARRRLVALGETCPCGARLAMPNRAARRAARHRPAVLVVQVEHEADCPAVCRLLDEATS